MKTLIGSDEVSSLEVPILELSGWPTCSAIPSCQRLSLLLSAVQPRSELEEFYRRFFHLVCLNLPIMFKCLRLYVSTSYFKTDIVLFPAPSTLVIWLWRIFQKSYQQVFACETPTICQRGQVSRFFNWPIIVCVLLKCLFLSVAMDCNLVPMDCNLVPMDCDLVPMDCDLVRIKAVPNCCDFVCQLDLAFCCNLILIPCSLHSTPLYVSCQVSVTPNCALWIVNICREW